MQICYLGPLEVRADGQVLDVPGQRLRRLLLRLAVDAGRPVSTAELARAVWDDEQPVDPANSLQSLVSRLRRTLGGPEHVEQVGPGYRLVAEPDDVDAVRFTRWAAEGRRLLVAGSYAGAADLLRDALGLWRGEALADDQSSDADPERARLDELRLQALHDRAAADLRLGRATEVGAGARGPDSGSPGARGPHPAADGRAGRGGSSRRRAGRLPAHPRAAGRHLRHRSLPRPAGQAPRGAAPRGLRIGTADQPAGHDDQLRRPRGRGAGGHRAARDRTAGDAGRRRGLREDAAGHRGRRRAPPRRTRWCLVRGAGTGERRRQHRAGRPGRSGRPRRRPAGAARRAAPARGPGPRAGDTGRRDLPARGGQLRARGGRGGLAGRRHPGPLPGRAGAGDQQGAARRGRRDPVPAVAAHPARWGRPAGAGRGQRRRPAAAGPGSGGGCRGRPGHLPRPGRRDRPPVGRAAAGHRAGGRAAAGADAGGGGRPARRPVPAADRRSTHRDAAPPHAPGGRRVELGAAHRDRARGRRALLRVRRGRDDRGGGGRVGCRGRPRHPARPRRQIPAGRRADRGRHPLPDAGDPAGVRRGAAHRARRDRDRPRRARPLLRGGWPTGPTGSCAPGSSSSRCAPWTPSARTCWRPWATSATAATRPAPSTSRWTSAGTGCCARTARTRSGGLASRLPSPGRTCCRSMRSRQRCRWSWRWRARRRERTRRAGGPT